MSSLTNQSINQSTNQSNNQSINQSTFIKLLLKNCFSAGLRQAASVREEPHRLWSGCKLIHSIEGTYSNLLYKIIPGKFSTDTGIRINYSLFFVNPNVNNQINNRVKRLILIDLRTSMTRRILIDWLIDWFRSQQPTWSTCRVFHPWREWQIRCS